MCFLIRSSLAASACGTNTSATFKETDIRFSLLIQPATIPAALVSFDPKAGDCTCVHPVSQYAPPVDLSHSLREALVTATALESPQRQTADIALAIF